MMLLPILLAACGPDRAEPPPPPILLPVEDVGVPAVSPPEPPAPPPVPAKVDDPDDSLVASIATAAPPTPERAADYSALREKSVVELQQWRESQTLHLDAAGAVTDAAHADLTVTFMDLNPWVHAWFIVQLQHADGRATTWHLENHDPAHVRVWLDPQHPSGLVLSVDGEPEPCPLWPGPLQTAKASGRTYAPLCDGRLSLRNPAEGRRSAKEWGADFLRDNVWGGEKITTLVRDTVYKDSELATSELVDGPTEPVAETRPNAPRAPAIAPDVVGQQLVPVNLGLPLVGADAGTVEIGHWYPVEHSRGLYVTALQPRYIDPAIWADWGAAVQPLDDVENSALAYFVAFDLRQHELRFDVGTDHPRVGWSERVLPSIRDNRLPGPDGFDKIGPLVRTGQVNPASMDRLVATFTGGFKRSHGAFKAGDLALVEQGSHYGWIEHGVVESRPRPGLVTVVVDIDGTVDLRVWSHEDDADLWRIVHLRQNGVPLLTADGRPGDLVNRWSMGNWSGSVEGKLRSVRGSLCVQPGVDGSPDFLIYGYFSSATPSAQARVLAGLHCGVAMLTDMNALEHTYLSIHDFHGGDYTVHHLIRGMEVLDKERQGVYLPRFVGLADNRDFFTVLRRSP
ncbi:MAG: hypothetical protein H6742_16555 [Alphaproteobacteria bacterium]|nr:hypothetical protein [Alphaproteobacteria bacterium]